MDTVMYYSSARFPLQALFATATLVLLCLPVAGCFYGSPTQCENDSDCFQDEKCVAGTCQSAGEATGSTGGSTGGETTYEDGGSSDGDSGTSDRDGRSSGGDGSTGQDTPGIECPEYSDKLAEENSLRDLASNSQGLCANFDGEDDCSVLAEYESEEATCSDGIDNDCDGEPDCGDDSCAQANCAVSDSGEGAECRMNTCVETACSDGEDNDGDEYADDDDEDCDSPDAKLAGATCTNGTECLSKRCVDTECAHRIGLSAQKLPSDFSNMASANDICSRGASDDGGGWKALVYEAPDSGAGIGQIELKAAVVNFEGDILFNRSDVTDKSLPTPRNPIGFEKVDGTSANPSKTWTGYEVGEKSDGQSTYVQAANCDGWTEQLGSDTRTPPQGWTGNPGSANAEWLSEQSTDCTTDNAAFLYCIDGQRQ